MSQWIGPFFFGLWLKEYFLSNMTRMELFSCKYDTKNWTFLSMTQRFDFFSKKKPLTEFNLFSSNMTKELAFIISWIWRTELNSFFSNLSRIELFFQNTTQTFEHFWKIWLKELNFLFLIRLEVLNSLFWIRLKELNPFWCDSMNCFSEKRLKELNSFSKIKHDSKN